MPGGTASKVCDCQLYLATQRAFDFSEGAHLGGFLGRDFFEDVKDAFRCMAIPQRRLLHRLSRSAIQRSRRGADDPSCVSANDDIRAESPR